MKIKSEKMKDEAEPFAASEQNSTQRKTGRKKKRLKYIAVLPSFITLMNCICGFIAIIYASHSPVLRWNLSFMRRSTMTSFSVAGYMIFLAMIADMLDGRVARLTRTTSSFGGQLDSLSDAVTFGIAPAFLMMKLVEFHLAHLNIASIRLSLLLGRGVIFAAIFYVTFAVVRLARFNVENEEDESAHMNFSGLPSPAAAGIVASIVVFQQQILHRIADQGSPLYHSFDILTVSILPVVTLIAGILMVTRIRYPHVANQLFRGKKTLPVFLAIVAVGLLSIWNIQLVLVLGFCGFACFGFFRWCYVKLFRRNSIAAKELTQRRRIEGSQGAEDGE